MECNFENKYKSEYVMSSNFVDHRHLNAPIARYIYQYMYNSCMNAAAIVTHTIICTCAYICIHKYSSTHSTYEPTIRISIPLPLHIYDSAQYGTQNRMNNNNNRFMYIIYSYIPIWCYALSLALSHPYVC